MATRGVSPTRVFMVIAAIACLLIFVDRNDAASGIGRQLPVASPSPRYVIIGNSEGNAILTHSPDVFHLWESRSTFVDRLVQMHFALETFPGTKAILVSVHPAELAVSPRCLLFRTAWPVGNENSSLIPRRPLAAYRYARATDVLVSFGKLAEALDGYLRIDPVRLIKRTRGQLPPGKVYRANGSLVRNDPRKAPAPLTLDSFSSDAFRVCNTSERSAAEGQADAMEVLRALIQSAKDAGVPVVLIVTPLHRTYRSSVDSFLADTLPHAQLSVAALIDRLASLGVPVIDDSRLFDNDDLSFLNGNHLSSSGEQVYGPLLLPRVRALCLGCR